MKSCIARGFASYSRLARLLKSVIERQLGQTVSFDAVKAALIRYSKRLSEEPGTGEPSNPALLELLASSSVELKSDVNVAVVKLEALGKLVARLPRIAGRSRLLLLLQSLAGATIIADTEAYRELKGILQPEEVEEVWEGQSALIIVSPRSVVTVPGFIAYIAGLLASNNINIQQIESVYTDTVMILSPRDAIRAFNIVSTAITMARQLLKTKP